MIRAIYRTERVPGDANGSVPSRLVITFRPKVNWLASLKATPQLAWSDAEEQPRIRGVAGGFVAVIPIDPASRSGVEVRYPAPTTRLAKVHAMTQPNKSIGATIAPCAAIAAFLFSTQCLAAAITFNLTGDTSLLRVLNGNVPACTVAGEAGCAPPGTTIIETDYIIPSLTGFPDGFTIAVGDTLSGTLTLTNALSVPAGNVTAARDYGAQVYLNLGLGPTEIAALNIGFRESLTFLNGGVPVAESALFDLSGASFRDLILGGLASTPTPGFTFDAIAFSAQITALIDGATRQEFSTVDIRPPSGRFDFTYRVYNSPGAAVPEPGTLALAGLGLVCFGAMRRRATN